MSIELGQASSASKKVLIYKSENKGDSKKSGKPFHIVTLHDPVTLDNVDFFLPPTTDIRTDHLHLKDQVEVEIGFDVVYGRMQPALQSIRKL